MSTARTLAALALLALLAGCAGGSRVARSDSAAHSGEKRTVAPPADSVTLLRWSFDETGGALVADSTARRVDGHAGQDTRTDFGRIAGARLFTSSIESFVWSAYRPALESPTALTIEAWIRLSSVGNYELTMIACRWTPAAGEQSWLFAVGGRNLRTPYIGVDGPDEFTALLPTGFQNRALGKLMFAYQPREAGAQRAYLSSQTLELDRWTHVAVTFSGRLVRFYINGLLDAQYAAPGAIRESPAPLMVGNAFDPRWLTTFSGDMRVLDNVDRNAYYALDGSLDELRISDAARTDFPYAR